MSELVQVDNLRVSFGRNRVVDGISFTVHRGECLALVGESGSGKSVTARTLVGLTGYGSNVSADALRFDGSDVLSLSERRWRAYRGKRIGFVLQDALSSLDPLRPVGKEIAEPLRLHTTLNREQRREKVLELLESVGVPEAALRASQYPHQLSGGLRQRALIASAIACGPELLIADEPTTALDATIQAQILALLKELKSSETGMLIVSHDLSVVARLADRVAVMRAGQIVEEGPTQQVLSHPRHEYTRALLDAVPTGGRGRAAPADGPELIRASSLTKSFDGKIRVDGVSLGLRAGETLGIVGESGSGKTTTARLVLGLEKPDGGTVNRPLSRRDWQIVYQDPLSSFDPRYTVERVVGEPLPSANRRERVVELLRLVALDEGHRRRRPLELSGGQRQRIAIARALACDPSVIVCDEPVSALDVSVQAQILELLDDLQARLGIAYLFISHDLAVVRKVSDRVLVMKDGVVVEHGDTEQVFTNPQHVYTKELINA